MHALLALLLAAAVAPARPAIVAKPIPFGPARRAETAATWSTFAGDVPDTELHELPGTCAHFVIDRDGTIYQLVQLSTICRHTVGLNWTAIGIEHVGTSDASVLQNAKQMAASLRLTLWLMHRFGISLPNVIGHNESLTSRYHRERYAPWRCQTHGDWVHADMRTYRARLAALARSEHVALSRVGGPVASHCR